MVQDTVSTTPTLARSPLTGAAPALTLLSDSSLTQLVNSAFRNYQSTLALSRTPLANSALVTPTLVLDDVSPTAEERGRGLRLVLQWAVERIAPGPITYPPGAYRPFDDPTWSDPLWWRYNILRHRYLEPLHPDDFVDGGRFTETLMALTGISSSDAFFDERNRAIQEITERLRQQLIDGAANQSLQQMALTEIVRLLDTQEDAANLLGIAATFDEVFPRSLLLTMAAMEQIRAPERAVDDLITNRLLLTGDARRSLWLSPTLRIYIYQRQPAEALQRRHRTAARYYAEQEAPLTTARHWQQANVPERAINILFQAAEALVNELQVAELIQSLQHFTERGLSSQLWRECQILLSDLYYRGGQPEDALAACRRALKVTEDAQQQARIYRRLGKLYVTRNQLHALGYYQQAAERFDTDHPELPYLLKDRGWLYMLRRSWTEAENDLQLALSIAAQGDDELRADVLDALASLYLRQQRAAIAIAHARNALALRERMGNLPRIASSFNNLGLIYLQLGEYWQAISAYEEALVTYRKLGNQESIAGALLNIGMAWYLLQQYEKATDHYQQSLTICQSNSLPHVEATVRYNLAEAYAAMGRQPEAIDHWQRGYELSQRSGFADEVNAFEQLRAETALLQAESEQQTGLSPQQPERAAPPTLLSPEEASIIKLAEKYGRVSAKLLTDQLPISRATATRRLSALAEAGHLAQHGKGRGTYYTLVENRLSRADQGQSDDGSNSGPNAPSMTETIVSTDLLLPQLTDHADILRKRFAVTTVEAASPAVTPTMPRLAVHFTEIPTLAEFCELRAYIQQTTGVMVDLVPIF